MIPSDRLNLNLHWQGDTSAVLLLAGIPKEAVQDVYTQAITKAATDKEQVDLSNAFVAAFTQLDTREHSNKLLDSLLTAIDYTITFDGCKQPEPFAKGERTWLWQTTFPQQQYGLLSLDSNAPHADK